MPDFDAIVHTKPRGERSGEDESSIRRPLTVGSIRCIDGGDLSEGPPIKDVKGSPEVSEPAQGHQPTMRIERNEVVEVVPEVVEEAPSLIK